MARYIDAEKMPNDKFFEDLSNKEKCKVIQWLLQAPRADVKEVKRGHWIVSKTEHGWNCCEYPAEYTCSECGRVNPPEGNYCPNCGADMRSEEQ